MRWSTFWLTTAAVVAAPAAAFADGAGAGPASNPGSNTGSNTVSEVVITAKRLDAARQSIQPQTGASVYSVSSSAIDLMAGGDNVPLNQVMLQMPSAAQDQYGQLHLRGDHANIQYRFDGVILPEGLSFFSEVVSPRIASNIELLTGALPAEYGLRTAGVVNITTKSGLENGGEVSIYGGSHGEYEPSIEYGGSSGANSYFVSGSYMQNQLGIDGVNANATQLHDRTTAFNGFGYFDHIIDQNSRVSFFAGGSNQTFQIPNPPGLEPQNGYQFNGQTTFPSQDLNQNQREINEFAAVSYLFTTGDFSGQASVFSRYSSLRFDPDPQAELLYNGFYQSQQKETVAFGMQAEGAYKLGTENTVRAGLIFENDKSNSASIGQAFEADTNINSPTYGQAIYTDANGNNIAETIRDDSDASEQIYTAYLQDEWKPIESFVLNYGLRFDQLESYRVENQLSPRVNFVWNPLSGTTVSGGYSRYFTPPPFELVNNETLVKYSTTVNWPYATHQGLPNEPLDTTPYSERDNYFDLAVLQKVTKNLTIDVDGYYRTARNLIDEGQFGEAIILTPFNYKYGKIHGGAVTVNYDKGPFSAYWNVSYVRAMGEDVESSQFNFGASELAYIQNHYIFLDHNETWSSSFGLAYRWRDTKVSLDGIYGSGLRATGSDGIPNGVSLPTYTTFNLSLLQKLTFLPIPGLDARFDVVNLLDKAYEIRDGTGVGVGTPSWGARRGFFAGLTKHF